jgi:propanol-preferring alcohol dehydrogenase
MVLTEPGSGTVALCEREIPVALPGEVLVRVHACGVCAIDLQIVDGERDADVPMIPGHEIVGVVEVVGDGVTNLAAGARVGIAWLGHACGVCERCASGRENLCAQAQFTGLHMDGGFAEYAVADAGFTFALPERISDTDAAPLLCAGAIGYRACRMIGEAKRLSIYGDGPTADLIAQIAAHQQRTVHRFADGADDTAPAAFDAAIVAGGHGEWLPNALAHLAPGGSVVCIGPAAGDVPGFPYGDLAEDRVIRSVTNATRDDVREMLALAGGTGIRAVVQTYALADASRAMDDVRNGRVSGAAVLTL